MAEPSDALLFYQELKSRLIPKGRLILVSTPVPGDTWRRFFLASAVEKPRTEPGDGP